MSQFEVSNMSSDMSRTSFVMGEIYFWLFMMIASWAALSGAPWTIALVIGAVLTLGNILARWGEWRAQARLGDYVVIGLNWAAVYAWQTTVIFIVFAVARYLRRFVPEPVLFRELESWLPITAVLCALALAFGIFRILDDKAEVRKAAEAAEAVYQAARKAPMDHPRADQETFRASGTRQLLNKTPLTFDTLYVRYHATHQLWTKARGVTGFADLDRAESSEEKIAAAEARLGLAFPDDLRRCYLVQNGGSLGAVLYETSDGWEDAIDTLDPLEALRVLSEATHAEPTTDYPNPAQTLIIAQDDYDTLLVDLVTGSVTLECSPDYAVVTPLSDEGPAMRWASLAAFLGSLHRVPVTVAPKS